MRIVWITLLTTVLLLGGVASAQNAAAEKFAAAAAQNWLGLVDAGDYGATWDSAAQYFKNAVPKDQWIKMLQASRAPLGKLASRQLRSARYTTTLPGAPDGQYVVIQYDSSFENKRSAFETVTPMLDQDGRWKVLGYFIR